jgi:hypothetical protein
MRHALDAFISWGIHGPSTLVYLSVIPGNVLATAVIARIWSIAGFGNIGARWIILIAALLAGLSMLGVALARRGY